MSAKPGLFGLGSAAKTAPNFKQKPDDKKHGDELPPYNVVLLNDEDHTYDYVIKLLHDIFLYPEQKAYRLAKCVDQAKRAVVFTCHKELAELKREQIQSFGSDPRVSSCSGSMAAVVEPA